MKARIRDIDVHYEEVGAGRPIFILHGSAVGNSRMAMHEFEPFFVGRSGWRRIYPDAIGHGLTPMPPDVSGHDAVVRFLLETIDVVAPGERLVIVGWSWGGYLARALVRERQAMVDGVMLYVPMFGPAATLPQKSVIDADEGFETTVAYGEEWLADMLTTRNARTLEGARASIIRLAEPATGTERIDSTYLSTDPDKLASPCMAPALVITGRQDGLVGYQDQLRLMANFPRGTFATLDGAGHLVSAEQPGLFASLTNEWLDRVERHIQLL